MGDTTGADKRGSKIEEDLAEMITRATSGPGVLDLMRVYDGAEHIYVSAIPEPRIWVTTSTRGR